MRLDGAMADDLSVVNAARVSFGVRKEAMEERDEGLIRFLMRESHGTPFEHNAFRFHVRCPIFVAREWFRHRVGCLAGESRVAFARPTEHVDEVWSRRIADLHAAWTGADRDELADAPLRVLDEGGRVVHRRAASPTSSRAACGRSTTWRSPTASSSP